LSPLVSRLSGTGAARFLPRLPVMSPIKVVTLP